MIERTIYCKEKHLKDISAILDVCVPNNYDVDLGSYSIHRTNYDDGIAVQVLLGSQKDWTTLKKNYFEGMYRKKALPGSIVLI